MQRIHAFPPLADNNARVLILGSMPGTASLAAAQYYAHARNQFWPILENILGVSVPQTYAERQRMLRDNHIALWDVLANCVRAGSLDSAIREECANDFSVFLKRHPAITHIFFNGQPARKLFDRHVLRTLPPDKYVLTTLPSTSPANAGWSFSRKLEVWRSVVIS